MAFGHFITKWCIRNSALEVNSCFKVCCHLHNFIILEQVDWQGQVIEIAYENEKTVFLVMLVVLQQVVPSCGRKSFQNACPKLHVWQRKFEEEHREMYYESGKYWVRCIRIPLVASAFMEVQPISPFFDNKIYLDTLYY